GQGALHLGVGRGGSGRDPVDDLRGGGGGLGLRRGHTGSLGSSFPGSRPLSARMGEDPRGDRTGRGRSRVTGGPPDRRRRGQLMNLRYVAAVAVLTSVA